MGDFVVSALKYRPRNFNTIVGQQAITQTLQNAIKNNQLAQAFLFCGPRGVGKTTCARVLARAINCEKLLKEVEPCNSCNSCDNYNNNQSFNIHEIDAASNNSVDDIRNLVDQVRFAPQTGNFSIYIIDEAHMLSKSAFNAFLKTLEEPPRHAIFILATTEKHKIIPTILSRCQIFDFKRISVEDIVSQLSVVAKNEGVEVAKDALVLISQKADGAMRDALSIFDRIANFTENKVSLQSVQENLNILDWNYFFKAVECFLNKDIQSVLLLFDKVINKGFDGVTFIDGLVLHFRNLLVSKDSATIQLLETTESVKEMYVDQSKKTDNNFLLNAIERCAECANQLKNSNAPRFFIELTLMQICSNESIEKKKIRLKIISPVKSEPVKSEPVKSESVKSEPVKSEPVKSEPVKQIARQKKSLATLSVNEFLSAEEKKEEPTKLNNGDSKDKISLDILNKTWEYYSEMLKTEGRNSLYHTMCNKKLEIKDETKIILSVESRIQKKEVENEKLKLLNLLRKKLNNYKVTLEVLVDEKQKKDLVYTPKEKFKYMVEKNPEIRLLKDQFNLEIDF